MSAAIHLEEALERDVGLLRAKVGNMGGLVVQALASGIESLRLRNRRTAYSVILRDQYVDELETEIDRLCLEFLVRHQPVGGDLRLVFAALQINRELERIGDYAESIARQALVVCDLEPQAPYGTFEELGEVALHMLHDAIRSFEAKDADLARRTMPLEERANILRSIINGQVAELRQKNLVPAAAVTPLLTVARRLERAADQTKNICEEVLYMCTGEFAKHKSADLFRILFFDSHNGSLSQIAEGIGNSIRVPRFVFSSAGVTPRPLDSRVLGFLAGKGIDVSLHTSKSLDQLPGWESSQVLVTLDSAAKEALPPLPGKMIRLCWEVPGPWGGCGGWEPADEDLQSACGYLESHIRDLISAVLEEPQSEKKNENKSV